MQLIDELVYSKSCSLGVADSSLVNKTKSKTCVGLYWFSAIIKVIYIERNITTPSRKHSEVETISKIECLFSELCVS